jgi:hypothetical protein
MVAWERDPGLGDEDPGGVAFEWVECDRDGELLGAGLGLTAVAGGEEVVAGPLVDVPPPVRVPPVVPLPLPLGPPPPPRVPLRRGPAFVAGRR